MDATATIGQIISLPLQVESTDPAMILGARKNFFSRIKTNSSASRGRIRVQFKDVTITPAARTTFATVTAGQVWYPTTTPDPDKPAKIQIARLTVLIDSLSLTPSASTAMARLTLPSSLIDDSGCGPALLNLGAVSIRPDCQIYKEPPDSSYAPLSWITPE